MKATGKRKLIRFTLVVITGLVVLLALLPVWFPWVLKPILSRLNLRFTQYERVGYTHFVLQGLSGEWKGTRLEARRIDSVLPNAWVWRKLFDPTNAAAPYLTMQGGDLIIGKSSTRSTARTNSLDKTLNRVVKIGGTMERLLPMARLTNCSIQIQSNRIHLHQANWQEGHLYAWVTPPKVNEEIPVEAHLKSSTVVRLSLESKRYHTAVRGEFFKGADGWRWEGDIAWLMNFAVVTAQIGTNGWWPMRAQVSSPSLKIPAQMARLPGYENLNVAFTAGLLSNQFTLQATGFAQPSQAREDGFPPVNFSLAAQGDPSAVHLTQLHVQSPYLKAHLTGPVGLTWRGGLLAKPAELHVALDLDKLGAASLAGRANAAVRVQPQGWGAPTAHFTGAATNISAWRVEANSIQLEGEFAFPRLKLQTLTAVLADGSKLAANGELDLKSRELTNATGQFSGGYLRKFLPGMNYDELVASCAFRGPLTNFFHDGSVTVKGIHHPSLNTLDLTSKWHGQYLRLDDAAFEIAQSESAVSFRGAFDLSRLGQRAASARLTNFSLLRKGDLLYQLQQPCYIAFRKQATNSAAAWTLSVQGFHARSPTRAVSLDGQLSWPTQGNMTAALTNVALSDFSGFVTNKFPDVHVGVLKVGAQWSNSPVYSSIWLAGTGTNRTGQVIGLRCDMSTGRSLSINDLAVESGMIPTLAITGSVPVQIIPGLPETRLEWDESKSIALNGTWRDLAEQISVPLGRRGRVEISNPRMHLKVSGTPDAPAGLLQATASAISWQYRTNARSPNVQDFQLTAEVHRGGVKLDTLSATLDGQLIQATGDWEFSQLDWRKLLNQKVIPDWSKAHGRLEIQDSAVAVFAQFLPQIVAPEGRVSAIVELKAGKEIDGNIFLTNAATRTLGKLTRVRDIAADIHFDGSRAELRKFRAELGGQPVRAEGYVTLAEDGLDYQVNLTGTNVPLARGLELLLRGDLNLRLRGGSNQPPVISGSVKLHNGLYLQHASEMVWGQPARPAVQPPYFSVTNDPVADWQLDVAVTGNRFLRTRTPVFTGVLSANLKLGGSMGAPVLTGDLRTDSGRITFPFGTLDVNQGFASFSGNDPQGPDLQIGAAGKNFNYDVRLDVKGPANLAEVTFSSTPPLTSEQVLLMLTAGELPESDFTYSRTARAGRFATFLGKDLIARFLGNDRKEERLIIRTGESISEEGRLTYSVEYRLSDRWSLIGEYDEYNAFNADVKWKIFTR